MTDKTMTKIADPALFRAHFPACSDDFIYLDSAATALKPQILTDTTIHYYQHETATAFRSQSTQASKVTKQIEQARQKVAQLLGNVASDQIIWTSGTTASINLVAYAFGLTCFNTEIEIIVSELEHHSNFIPWQNIAKLTGASIKIWQAESDGSLCLDRFKLLLSSKTALVAITQMSNVTGYQPDLAQIIALAHAKQAKVLVDGAQGCLEYFLNVAELDVDFYAFSAHKYYGPTGLGVLYGKRSLLESMHIWQGGGKMVRTVEIDNFVAAPLPYKFEAGTPNIAAVLGFGAVLNWLDQFDYPKLIQYTKKLTEFTQAEIKKRFVNDLILISDPKSHLITFVPTKVHCDDLAMILSQQNIAIRTGKLCAHPLLQRLNHDQVLRLSILPYNNKSEIEQCLDALEMAFNFLND